MKEILGKAKSVRELLKGVKYSIDYYQREYKWHDKQLRELIDDLSSKFLEEYQPEHDRRKVAEYPHYFLGSIIVSKKESANYIVDGQQRLTSLTLLLIYLRNLEKELPGDNQVNIDELIVSVQFGQKSFNLDVEERRPCMEALFQGTPFDATDRSESVQNLVKRFSDIDECFPEELRDEALPYFIDWLLENVNIVEITAYSDDDAYTIFETMNDRGLSISPTDMLKGFLLANITDPAKRATANQEWRDRILELTDIGRDVEPDFFKAWLRSQYATKIRERKKGAKPEDYDRIGTEFHRWLRNASQRIGLKKPDDSYRFIERDFDFYSRQYLRIVKASENVVPGLEYIRYNADRGFTLQNVLLLAPLKPDDADDVVRLKLQLVARFVDILLAWRLWNFRSISYSTMQYAMFLVMRDIRDLEPAPLAVRLHQTLTKETETFANNERFRMHQQNRWAVHRFLARITDYVETQSGNPSKYDEFVRDSGKNRFEVEHIWADKADRHTDEFTHPTDFAEYRNRIGGLLLLPKSFNASYGSLIYEKKLPHYDSQNLLARSLNEHCYDHNPGFLQFISKSALPFHAHQDFKKADQDARGVLYRQIAERIWDPGDVLRDVGK
jgi:uncharacterized protein with ParB-like and HNH nuclease domain